MSEPRSRLIPTNREWLVAGVMLLVVVGLAAPFWNVPLSRDQGVYATCAATLLRGGVPFRDCWDTKGPALHYTYALARLIFGRTTAGPYVLNAIAIGLSSIVMSRLFWRWTGARWPGYVAGLLYGVLAVAVRFDFNAQPESFANLFALLGLLCLTGATRADRRRWLYPAGGAALTIAVLYKYALLLPYGVIALAVLLTIPQEWGITARLRVVGLTLAGSLALVATFGLYLLANHALGDALTHLRFIFFYFPKAQLNPDEYALRSQPIPQTLAYFGRLPAVLGLALIGCGVALARRRWYGLPLALYILAGVAVVWGQQRFTPYHWTALLPALALCVGMLLVELSALPTRPQRVLSVGILMAACTNAALFFYIDQWLELGPYLTGRVDQEIYYSAIGTWDHKIVGEYIRERTDPDDPIWVWGHHTAVYYIADRRSSTRFIYNEPLLMRIAGGNPWQDEWQQEALDDLYADPPVYLVMTLFDRTFFDFQNPDQAWLSIPAYARLIDMHYQMVYPFGRFQVWQLIPYWSRHNRPELFDAVTVVDLLDRVDQATVLQRTDPPIEVRPFVVPPESGYDTILMQSGGALAFDLDLPPAPICLRFDASMYPYSWDWGGDGATFTVEVEAGEERATLAEFHISNDPLDRHWHDYLLDLGAYGGQSIRLIFRTLPGPAGDFTGDWAGWGQPRLVRPPSGDQCDTNAIVDTRLTP